MNKYTSIIFKYKKALIITFFILNIIALIGITRIKLNTDFSMFAPNESIYQDKLDELEEVFGELNQIIVIVEHDQVDSQTLLDLRSIQEKLELMDNNVYVQGVAPETLRMNTETGPQDVPFENVSWSRLVSYYNAFGEFSPLIQKDEVYYSSFTVFINSDFGKDDVGAIEDLLDEYSYSSYVSGDAYNQNKISDYIIKILLLLPPLTILTILLVFRWQMGAFKPTFMSILPAAVGSLWTFGLIGWIGNEISILTAIVPIFIIVIGSADGLHFMSHFQDSKKEGKENKTSLNETLKLVGIPMIVTTLTSMAGFISLLSMNTDSIWDLAIFSAVGILFAGIATWYVLTKIHIFLEEHALHV